MEMCSSVRFSVELICFMASMGPCPRHVTRPTDGHLPYPIGCRHQRFLAHALQQCPQGMRAPRLGISRHLLGTTHDVDDRHDDQDENECSKTDVHGSLLSSD